EPGHHLAASRPARQPLERLLVVLLQRLQLRTQDSALLRRGLDKEVAHIRPRQPQVAAQRGYGRVLLHVAAIDLEVLLRDADLDAVRFVRGKHQDRDHCAVSGPQDCSLAEGPTHYAYLISRARVPENTIFSVWDPHAGRPIIEIYRVLAASRMAPGR